MLAPLGVVISSEKNLQEKEDGKPENFG